MDVDAPAVLAGFLSELKLAKELCHHPRTLARWRKLGVGPPFTMIGRFPFYETDAAREWLAAGGTRAPPAKKRARWRATP